MVDEFAVAEPKTKALLAKLGELGTNEALIVVDQPDENLYLAGRNLYAVDVRDVAELDPVSLVAFDKVIMSKGAVQKLEERLA